MKCKLQRLFVVWLLTLNTQRTVTYLASKSATVSSLLVIADAYRKSNATLPSSAAVERLFSVAAQVLTSRHFSYKQRLEELNLISLELRRLHLDLIMCYKITFGLVKLCFEDFFQFSPNSTTRGHPYKLFVPQMYANISSPVGLWNPGITYLVTLLILVH